MKRSTGGSRPDPNSPEFFLPDMSWSHKDQINLFLKLEMYISAGLTTYESLQIVSEGMNKSRKKKQIVSICNAVSSGSTFSRSLKDFLNTKDSISSLISHGESSGSLGQCLKTARVILEKEQDLRRKCTSALLYPMIIGIFALLMTIGLMRGIMPQIAPMLRGLGVPLPFLTRFMISVSDIFAKQGLYILLVVAIICIVLVILYRHSIGFRRSTQYILIKIPLIGNFLKNHSLIGFLRSMGSLIVSGASSTRAFSSVSLTISILPIRNRYIQLSPNVDQGVPVGQVILACGAPSSVSTLLLAGEKTGVLGESMLRSAEILETDLDLALKNMTSLIEPLMMVCMGTGVGLVALSIILPIYDISKVLQR